MVEDVCNETETKHIEKKKSEQYILNKVEFPSMEVKAMPFMFRLVKLKTPV